MSKVALITGITGQDGSFLAEVLIENGYEPAYGARPMRRLIQREIEDPVAFAIISGKASTANEIVIDFKKEKITI